MTQAPPSPFHLTPWVRRLLAANAVVHLLSITVFTGPWFGELLAFSPLEAAAKPWTFVTYMFVHAGLLHLAFNMLMLFFFGPGVERRMGGVAFARFYLLCGLGGPVLAFGLSLFMPVAPFVGASAAVFGVALAFAMYWPQARIFVFPLPIPVPVWFLVAFLVVMDLIPLVVQVNDGVAHLAHLGGFLFGLLYLKGEDMVERRARPVEEAERETPVLVHRLAAKREERQPDEEQPAPPAPPGTSHEEVSQEIDRVLDKISRHGMASLTVAERRFLDDMSRQMRRH